MELSGVTLGLVPTIWHGYAPDTRMLNPFELQGSGLFDLKNSTETATISRVRLLQFLAFLFSKSPPHQLYLLYNNDYPGLDDILKTYSQRWTACTVIEFRHDLNLLEDIVMLPLSNTNIGKRHILVISTLENTAKLFEMVASRNLESPMNWWVIFALEEEVVQVLQGLLREGSQVLVVQLTKQQNFKLLSSYIRQNGEISFRETGIWSPTSKGYQNNPMKEVYRPLEDTYSDFGGRQLIVTANDNIPFFGMREADDGGYLPDSGIDISVMDALGGVLNFTYRVMKPSDGKWGGPLPDGTITGMIGEVARRKAHIAICEITITGTRESVIDFTRPYYLESLTVISPAPAEKNRAFAAFSPFTSRVWICITISTLAIGPLLAMETWFMKNFLGCETTKYSLNNFSFNMFRSLVGQTNFVTAKYWPHRLTFFFWYLFCLNILVLYSGTLTAVLVTPVFEKPIDYLIDLPNAVDDGTSLGIVGDSSFEYLLKDAKEGIYREVWQLFNHKDRSKSFFPHPDAGFNKILPDKMAFINPQLNSKIRAIKRGLNKFHFAKQSFYPQGYGLACFSGAPFMEKFNKVLSYMLEGGLISKWADEEVSKVAGKSISDDAKSGPTAITLKHLQAAFFVLTLGFLIAGSILGFELAYSKVRTYQRPTKIQWIVSPDIL